MRSRLKAGAIKFVSTVEEIENMEKTYGWKLLRTSAKTGEKVEQAFYEIAELMLKKN